MGILKSKPMNMLEGPILKQLIVFALPIFFGNVFQQLYSMVDSIIVGKWVSANALAAVGSTTTLSFVIVGLLMGFAMGASVMVSQFLGAGQKEKIKPAIGTALWLLIIMSIIFTAIGLLCAKPILRLLQVPEEIFSDTLTYFRIFLFGVVFMALYNFFASFLRALGDSITPLIFLIVSSVLNIFGDMFFVIVLKLGVAGVGYATVIAQLISVVFCYIYVSKTNEYFRFSKGELKIHKELLPDIFRLGVPSCLQSSISGFGMVAVQGLINSYGTVSMAAYTAASRMEQICNLPLMGIAMALSLFVGQNVGAKNIKRTKQGLWQAMGLITVLSIIFSGAIFLFGKYIMLLFVNQEEINVIEVGARFMRTWAPLVFIHGFTECFVGLLRGSGDSVFSMLSMFFDLIVRMVAAYVIALFFGVGFMGIAIAIPCGWFCSAVFSGIRYFTGGWQKKGVVK